MKIIHGDEASYQFNLSMVVKQSARESAKVELLMAAFNEVFTLHGTEEKSAVDGPEI